jgi:hypothetical protein
MTQQELAALLGTIQQYVSGSGGNSGNILSQLFGGGQDLSSYYSMYQRQPAASSMSVYGAGGPSGQSLSSMYGNRGFQSPPSGQLVTYKKNAQGEWERSGGGSSGGGGNLVNFTAGPTAYSYTSANPFRGNAYAPRGRAAAQMKPLPTISSGSPYTSTGGATTSNSGTNLIDYISNLLRKQQSDEATARKKAEASVKNIESSIGGIGGGKVADYLASMTGLAGQISQGMTDEERKAALTRLIEEEVSPAFGAERTRIAEQGGPGARQMLNSLRLKEQGARLSTARNLTEQQLAAAREGRGTAAGIYGSAAQLGTNQQLGRVNSLLGLESLKDYSVPDSTSSLLSLLGSQSPGAAFSAIMGAGTPTRGVARQRGSGINSPLKRNRLPLSGGRMYSYSR